MRQHVSVRVHSLGWVCGMQERLCEGAERPCEGAVRPRQPCASVPPSHFENFRPAWKKCVAKFGNARPRPKQDKYVRTRSTSVKKERRGFPLRD